MKYGAHFLIIYKSIFSHIAMPQLDPSILQLAFACHICGKTVSDLYRDKKYGLNDGTSEIQVANMLWITSCDHVICRYELSGQ